MKIEILMSVMNQSDMSIAKKSKANADILIINQCDCNDYKEEIYNGHKIRMISTTERGLSKSRNMALKNALGDICILCDDDEVYRPDYKEAVLKAFEDMPKADMIAFNIGYLNERGKGRRINKKTKKASRWRTYGSCSLAFKRDNIISKDILFDTNFGAGSGKITHGEEAIWQNDLRRLGIKIYQHTFCIADVAQSDSTWFEGYNPKYFYNMGCYLERVYPRLKYLLKYYYIYRLNGVTKLSIHEQIKWLKNGIKGYSKGLSYDEYI